MPEVPARGVGQADARGEVEISRRRQRSRDTGISGEKDSRGRTGKNDRRLARFKCGDAVIFFIPGLDAIPAQTVVQRQVGTHAPAILPVQAPVLIAAVEGLKLALVVLAGNSEQEIGEVGSGLAAGEQEIAVELRDRIGVDLVVVKFRSEFHGVAAHDFREIIEPLESVVDLLQFVGVCADGKGIEDDVFNSFALRIERHNAGSSRAGYESLRCQADAESADGFAEIVVIAHVAEVEFIDRRRPQRFSVAQAEQLSAS